MKIKNLIIFFILMLISTIINKYYTTLFMKEANINSDNNYINIFIVLILGFITSKLADNILIN
jgi:hypothetical protein